MLSVEWLNSRPYYLNSTTTPFDYVWGGMWFLFNEDSADLYGSAPLNLGLRLSINLEVEIASPNAEPVFGRCEAWFLNRFRIDGAGNVQAPVLQKPPIAIARTMAGLESPFNCLI